jgi:pimeloyl-ACP methyl ester carboxylesterase
MARVTVGRENSAPIELHYEDHGQGRPVVLIHGWPASGRSWERQLPALVDGGHRVITYDRRGFGESSQPWTGHDYDTLTRDLRHLLTALDLDDVVLVGFSMGGGEVARYLGTYGSDRVSAAVFVAAVPPCLGRTADTPEGVDPSVFEEIQAGLAKDRPGCLTSFLRNFYNADVLGGSRISEDDLRAAWAIAVGASAKATSDVVGIWGTDFRADLRRVDVPVLVVHGDADRIVPKSLTGDRMSAYVSDVEYVVVADAPHGLLWTHADEVNQALLAFLRR